MVPKHVQDEVDQVAEAVSTRSYVKRADIVRPRIYLTHYNGGRPFEVVITSKGVDVFTQPRGRGVDAEYSVSVLAIPRFQGYWRGVDAASSGHRGTSLLIKENADDYVFIGGEVYRFRPGEEIVDFFSPMGNSDVPYPVALGEGRVYFMLEKLSLPKTQVGPVTPALALSASGRIYDTKHLAKAFPRLRQLQKLRV